MPEHGTRDVRGSTGLRAALTISLLIGLWEGVIMGGAWVLSIQEPLATVLDVLLIMIGSGPLVVFLAVRPLMLQATSASAAQAVAESRVLVQREFFATASHELRTPLVGILGSARLLDRPDLGAEQRELVTTILECGETLLQLIGQSLDLSKLEAGHLELENSPFVPQEVVRHVTQSLAAAASERGIQVRADVDATLGRRVAGDETRIRQVLFNLVGNALKFTPAGGSVTVRGRRIAGAPDEPVRLEFVVADTGVGMSAEALDRIFDRYAQADQSVTRMHGGTGLGLAISRELVESMGGSIGVTSAPGRGTEFYFSVLVGAVRTDGATPDGRAGPSGQRGLPPVPEQRHDAYRAPAEEVVRVLLVDDNQVNRRVLTLNLNAMGVHAEAVEDAAAAIEAVTREPYHLVLMDLFMPGLSGAEATARIRSTPGIRQPVIVGLSASGRPEDRQLCIDSGMDGYLSKPLDPHDFHVLVQTLPRTVGAHAGSGTSA